MLKVQPASGCKSKGGFDALWKASLTSCALLVCGRVMMPYLQWLRDIQAEFESRCEMYEAQVTKMQRSLERGDDEKAKVEEQLAKAMALTASGDRQVSLAADLNCTSYPFSSLTTSSSCKLADLCAKCTTVFNSCPIQTSASAFKVQLA